MGRAFFSDLIVTGFVRGIIGRYSHFDLNFVAAYECGDGILAEVGTSVTNSGNIYCNGNRNCGFYVQQATGQIGSCNYYSNTAYAFLKGNDIGLYSIGDSHIWLSRAFVEFNRAGVVVADHGGAMLGNSGTTTWVRANTWLDMFAVNGGFIRGWSYGGYLGSCSPSNRTVSNDNAYIAIDNN